MEYMREQATTKRKKIDELENSLSEINKKKQEDIKVSEDLLNMANKKLKKGLETKNFAEISLAQSLIDTVENKNKESATNESEANALSQKIEKNKNFLISDFF